MTDQPEGIGIDRAAIRRDVPRMAIAAVVLLVTGPLMLLIPDDGSPSTFDDVAFTVLAVPAAAAMFYLIWKVYGVLDWIGPSRPSGGHSTDRGVDEDGQRRRP